MAAFKIDESAYIPSVATPTNPRLPIAYTHRVTSCHDAEVEYWTETEVADFLLAEWYGETMTKEEAEALIDLQRFNVGPNDDRYTFERLDEPLWCNDDGEFIPWAHRPTDDHPRYDPTDPRM